MANINGPIARSARGELPLTWDALKQASQVEVTFFDEKLALVETRLFGAELDDAAEAALDPIVVEYAGKHLALKIINAGIDYWSKQATTIGATGRNETKGYLDRAKDLKDLRAVLTAEVAAMWPDVVVVLPTDTRVAQPGIPTVRDADNSIMYTPDPDLFEPAYGVPTTTTQRNAVGGGQSAGG